MDRLSDLFRLIYYDQRGRGKSIGKVQFEDVSIKSEIEDLEGVREYFRLETAAVLGQRLCHQSNSKRSGGRRSGK
jgi:proline iminopeptidase